MRILFSCSVVLLTLLAGCATYSQMMIGPNGEIKQCSATGGGALGMGAASSAKNSCVRDLEMIGYRKIESVGIIGVQYDGTTVTYVHPGSPADTAGVRRGDNIIAVDGQTMADRYEMRNALTGDPMTRLTLTIRRQDHTIDVPLQRRAYHLVFGTQ